MTTFSSFSHRLQPLYRVSKRVSQREMLQTVCDVIREHPTWNVAHIAAHVGLAEGFRHNLIVRLVTGL